jgi:hypothetical protein
MSQSLTILVPSDMDQAIRLAKTMATAKMLPKHLQGDEGTCLMIIEQAMRWGMSPFAVAQCTSSIGGKLMFEGKLVAAAVESSGAIEGHFDYVFDGDGDDRRVTVSARRRGETNPRQMTIRIKDVRTNNEWWRRQPDQMLVYSGTRNWARRFTPAALLGIYSPEEFDRKTGQIITEEGPVIEAEPQPPAADARATAPRPRTRRDFLDALTIALRDAQTAEEVDRIVCAEDVMKAKETFTNGLKTELDKLIADALNKWWNEPPTDEVHIQGEEKVGAG